MKSKKNWLARILTPENEVTGGEVTLAKASPSRIEYRESLENMQTMAIAVAKSGMFGVRDEAQALSLMLLCHAEGLHPVLALRRYHIIEGKPSMRADALQGEFERDGAILWHERTEEECSATFFRDKRQATSEALKRGKLRYKAIKAGQSVADLSEIGEMTIIRTMADAIEKKLAMSWKDEKWQMKKNWKQSPRQMLHARCLSEGVRAVAPGLVAGIYTEDEALDYLPEIPDNGNDAERRVKEATANRLAGGVTEQTVTGEVVDPVTEENFNDVICHIGKPEGQMLEKKVSEIHPKLLQWLQRRYGPGEDQPRWGDPPTQKDERLKKAVDFALAKL